MMRKNRCSIRLRGYDYAQAGAYSVTICTQNKECLFGNIVDGQMRLNDAGRMVQTIWNELPQRFPNVRMNAFIIMPNHLHGIIILTHNDNNGRGESCIRLDADGSYSGDHPNRVGDHGDCGDRAIGDHKDRPYGTFPESLGRVLQAFKSITTHQYICGVKQNGWQLFPGKLWQRNYYEHIVRDEPELNRIRQYIVDNPAKWELDRENPNRIRETDK